MKKKCLVNRQYKYEIAQCPETGEWIVYRLVYMSTPVQFTRERRSDAIALRYKLNRELRAERAKQ